jgi:hypothetical protein
MLYLTKLLVNFTEWMVSVLEFNISYTQKHTNETNSIPVVVRVTVKLTTFKQTYTISDI